MKLSSKENTQKTLRSSCHIAIITAHTAPIRHIAPAQTPTILRKRVLKSVKLSTSATIPKNAVNAMSVSVIVPIGVMGSVVICRDREDIIPTPIHATMNSVHIKVRKFLIYLFFPMFYNIARKFLPINAYSY